jgi:hypothetical protein
MEEKIWEELSKNWPSEFVSRGEIGVFSGGLLHPRTMANLDSLGQGPKVKVRFGRKIAYEKKSLIQWMRQHCKIEARQ